MGKIIIKSVEDLKSFNRKLKTLITTMATLRMFAIERAADEAVLTAIHMDMENNNFSKKIIDRTFVGAVEVEHNGKKITVHFISEYVADDGFEVSEGREEGTTDHDVFPKKEGGWITWIDPDLGKRIFRRKSHPSGIQRLLIIEKNIAANQFKFQESYEKEIASKYNQVLGN